MSFRDTILKRPRSPVNWKTNLAAVWISQFLTLSAFNFCLPFLPLYLKENNIVPEDETAFWSGLFIAAAPVSMMIMSPIWGALGDRYGRKMMLTRATLSGAFCIYLLSVIHTIDAMIVLRFLQGAFTGTTPAAQSLVAASTPDRRQGLALGLLMAAVSASVTAGAYFGGMYAAAYGAAAAFKFSAWLLLFSVVVVVALVREDFTPPKPSGAATRSARIRRRKAEMNQARTAIPALFAIAFVSWLQTYDGPFLALYVEELYKAGEHLSGDVSSLVFRMTGNINALASVIAVGGSLLISYLMDVRTPRVLWGGLGLAAGTGMLIIAEYGTILGLTAGRCVFLFFISGLSSVLVVLMSRMTPPEKRGAAIGWTVTARSIGWISAPIMGAWVANAEGYAQAYLWLGGASLALAPLFFWMAARYPAAFGREKGEPEAQPLDLVMLPPQSLPIAPRQTTSSARILPYE